MDLSKYGFKKINQNGSPIQIGSYKIIPQSESVSLQLPFGGFVYNRPVAVLVEKADQVDRIPIVDVTRRVLIGLAGLSLVFSLMLAIRAARSRRK